MEITATAPQVDSNDTDFGDFAGGQSDEEDIEHAAEPWWNYDPQKKPKVFYPICLGQVLREKYLVEHKLGFGGCSTVWMAYDLQDKTDVALKVMSLGTWAENETRIHEEIKQHVSDRSHLVASLDTFLLPRDNDDHRHRVLVLPLMGPCLSWDIMKKMSIVYGCSYVRCSAIAHGRGELACCWDCTSRYVKLIPFPVSGILLHKLTEFGRFESK